MAVRGKPQRKKRMKVAPEQLAKEKRERARLYEFEKYHADIEKSRALGRDKNKKHYAKQKANKKGWEPRFIGVDGESFVTSERLPDGERKQAYSLLLRHDLEPLYAEDPEKGLSTWECLAYLSQRGPFKAAFVGFFLNFDFEWILKDLSQDDYKSLQRGEQVRLFASEFMVHWFVDKKLDIYRIKDSARDIPEEERLPNRDYFRTSIQDVQGFFQTTFVNALKKWGFASDPRLSIITSGKAARGGFEWEDLDEISLYNSTEMELLEELMLKVHESFRLAYEKAGLDFRVHSQTWSGPGVFASDFLKQTYFVEQHEPTPEKIVRGYKRGKASDYGNDIAKDYPFSLAYYGGRIELAAIGKFESGYNYDVNSAYPYALSLLPTWRESDFKRYKNVGLYHSEKAQTLINRRLMGMYTVRFHFPNDWTWYPFPVRNKDYSSPNVFYPQHGVTSIMAPELFAVLDTLPEEALGNLDILDCIVLEHTEGYGDALNRMSNDALCTTAKKTLELADIRLQAKEASKRIGTPSEKEGDKILATAEKALKLILNSLYGKTIQQIGTHKYYNDFASAWITSTCRALLWRALAPERANETVLMTMTDGIYSTEPLPFAAERLSSVLGEWEETVFRNFEGFKPGIYRYEHQDKKGKWEMDFKVRGFLAKTTKERERLFGCIHAAIHDGTTSRFPYQQFLTRNVALKGWKREPWCRQFYRDMKDIKSELSAKRAPLPKVAYEVEKEISGKAQRIIEWESYKALDSEYKQTFEEIGKISVPENMRSELYEDIPHVFRAGKSNKTTTDLYAAAEQKGFGTDINAFVDYLNHIDEAHKIVKRGQRQFLNIDKRLESHEKERIVTKGGWLIPPGQANVFFPPKGKTSLNHSVGYAVSFELPEITEENADDYLHNHDARIGSEIFYESADE